MSEVIIGMDLGGTNLRIGSVTSNNQVEYPKVVNSQIIAKAENPLEKLGEIIKKYVEKNKLAEIKAISIGVPSSVDADHETVICTTNIRNSRDEAIFQHTNIAVFLREMFQVPVFINNDTNNILLYDVYAHNLEKQSVIIGIYIGTGVGVSVLIDGKNFNGTNGAALDIGHIPFYTGDAICSCGKRGCCECYASGWRLQQIREDFYPKADIRELFTLHKNEETLKEFIYSCAHICAIMATVFNPATMIVGGGVIEMQDFPKEEFEKQINQNTGRDVMSYGFQYVYSEPFAGKGVIGAAIFAKQMIKK